MSRRPNVINENEVEWIDRDEGDPVRRRQLGVAAGAAMIGCSLYELPPGSKAWPFHHHYANEEAVYVLEGDGIARSVDAEISIGPGDYLVLPKGEESGHQIINRSRGPLRYLCCSTMVEPEIAVYPDSGKIGVFAGTAPGGPVEDRTLSHFLDVGGKVDY